MKVHCKQDFSGQMAAFTARIRNDSDQQGNELTEDKMELLKKFVEFLESEKGEKHKHKHDHEHGHHKHGHHLMFGHGFGKHSHDFEKHGHGFGKHGHGFGMRGHRFGKHGHGFGKHGHGFGKHGHGFGKHDHGCGKHGDGFAKHFEKHHGHHKGGKHFMKFWAMYNLSEGEMSPCMVENGRNPSPPAQNEGQTIAGKDNQGTICGRRGRHCGRSRHYFMKPCRLDKCTKPVENTTQTEPRPEVTQENLAIAVENISIDNSPTRDE